MVTQTPVVVIEAGCAECWGPGFGLLIVARRFADVEGAKTWASEVGWVRAVPGDWQPHPQDGEYLNTGQGSLWILPLTLDELPDHQDD